MLFSLAACACGGGSPAAPVFPATYVLTAGAYTLNIFPAQSTPNGPVACTQFGGGAGTSIAIPVEVQRDGPGWIARPSAGTLRLTLVEVAGVAYYGPLDGSFTLGGTTVTAGSPGEPAIAMAFTLGASSLSGNIDGRVTYTSDSAQSSCNANNWSLIRR